MEYKHFEIELAWMIEISNRVNKDTILNIFTLKIFRITIFVSINERLYSYLYIKDISIWIPLIVLHNNIFVFKTLKQGRIAPHKIRRFTPVRPYYPWALYQGALVNKGLSINQKGMRSPNRMPGRNIESLSMLNRARIGAIRRYY